MRCLVSASMSLVANSLSFCCVSLICCCKRWIWAPTLADDEVLTEELEEEMDRFMLWSSAGRRKT